MNRETAFQQINEQLTNDYTIKSLFTKLKLISGRFVSDNLKHIGFQGMLLNRSRNNYWIDYYTGCDDDLACLMLEFEYDSTTPSGARFLSWPWSGDIKMITTNDVIKIMHSIKMTLWQIENIPMDAHTSNGPCIDFPPALLCDHINNQTLLNNPF